MIIVFGITGLLVISFAIWLKNERWQDMLFIVGGILLLVYSFGIQDVIFIALQIVFIVSALTELLRVRGDKNKR